MNLYRIEIKLRGTPLKTVAARAKDALSAINSIAKTYPIGPYEFTARRVAVGR